MRLYLQGSSNGAPHTLAAQRSTGPMSLTETRDLADRTNPGSRPPHELVLGEIEPREGAPFVTQPFDEPVDLAGRISGELDFTINKQDVDLVVMLYEVRASGEHVKLFDPNCSCRTFL